MALVLHDTLQRRKVPFAPREPGRVRMYNCGPTVYSHAHIGNFRAFLFADILRRWLELSGYEVHQVMNITDVGHLRDDADEGEDRMEIAAAREKLDPWRIAAKYTGIFMADVDRLRIQRAHEYPRATDYVPRMIEFIQGLIANGHAYRVESGDVYYAVDTFPDYGRLSGNTGDDLIAGARVETRADKRDPRDFALWKTDPHHLMQWDSPFGRGFPGWHIECSTMSRALLGDELDIHTGGEDNVFPHHECEIAQSEGLTGRRFVRHWLHTRFLQVDGTKMSKSLGNLYTVTDLEERGHPPVAVRFALIRGHYRQVLNFTMEGLEQAAADVRRMRLFVDDMREAAGGARPGRPPGWLTEGVRRFEHAMDDDLNVSGALGGVFSLMNEARRAQAVGAEAACAVAAMERFDRVLGVLAPEGETEEDPAFAAEIDALIEQRAAARAARDWATADRIRDELEERGIEVVDTGDGGVKWRRLGVDG